MMNQHLFFLHKNPIFSATSNWCPVRFNPPCLTNPPMVNLPEAPWPHLRPGPEVVPQRGQRALAADPRRHGAGMGGASSCHQMTVRDEVGRDLPCGKHTKNIQKRWKIMIFLIGESTISMAMFNSLVYQRV